MSDGYIGDGNLEYLKRITEQANQAIRDELINMKCDIAQGYLYARPMPQQEFIEWLNQYQPGDSVQQRAVLE